MPTPDDETRFMAPLEGAPMPERYEMLGELGRGGMGIVCKVRDRETGEVVALKMLKPEIAANPQILERFKNELVLAHKITHRHIARMYEFHRAGNAAYLSMEFVEGESLRGLLERQGKLDTSRAVEFARQLAEGLAEAHRQSIVHRDLKPENIMITPAGELKVMDFGISRSYAGDATVTGSVIGTPAYMAPEQAEGKALDHRTDIYAYGLVLYEMFTGEAAFSGDTAVTVALKQIRERPRKPTTLTPGIPKRIETAILRCLEKDPAARFQTIDEAWRALEGAAPTGPEARVSVGSRISRRVLASGAGAIVLAGIAAVVWWNWRSSDSITFPIEQFTLANGLNVGLAPDHAAPTITIAVDYRAGTRRDTPGHSGLAHLVQHVMHEGSPNVARGEFPDLIAAAGGGLGGGVNADVAAFWETLPANQLELALFLESDRMRDLTFTPEGLAAARSSMLEERARSMNSGYATARFRFNAVAFDKFANQQSTFGSVEDVNRATLDDVRKFYQTYYTPSNAGVVLVGDFDTAKARERIKHHFEGIPARPKPPEIDLKEPERTGEKRESAPEPGIPSAVTIISWQVPPVTDPDWFPLVRLGELLGGNSGARLQNSLVKNAAIATTVTVGLENSAGPNLFLVQLMIAPGKDAAQAEALTYEEIGKLAREGAGKEEMDRVQMDSLRRRAFELVTGNIRAQVMAQIMVSEGALESVNQWEKRVRSVTNEDVQRVARKYLTPSRRTVFLNTPGATP